MTPDTESRLLARLDTIEAKLDYVVERQAFVEDMVREMTPVVREAMTAMAGNLQTWEDRGWFAMGKELVHLFDTLAQAYGPDDVHELSGHVVQIVDTVRNLTQPEVLDLANEATEVLHRADEVQPVGPWGMAKAAGDKDVQRGMAVAVEILRHLGQASAQAKGAGPAPVRRAEPSATPAPPRAADAPAAPTAPAERATLTPQATPEVVEWQGRRFSGDGFLLDTDRWDEPLATAMAAGLGLTLTEDHWVAIRWARADYLAHLASPNVRRVATGSGLGTQKIYQLFPGTPGKTIAMIAGVPKPVGCV